MTPADRVERLLSHQTSSGRDVTWIGLMKTRRIAEVLTNDRIVPAPGYLEGISSAFPVQAFLRYYRTY